MADEPVTSREKKKRKKKDRGNKAVRKEDISSPGEVHHFYHLGPADSLSPDAGLQMQLPPPCPGQVNEDTACSKRDALLSPGECASVSKTVLQEIEHNIYDLRSRASELLKNAEELTVKLENLKSTMNISDSPADAGETKTHSVSAVDEHSETTNETLYENLPNGIMDSNARNAENTNVTERSFGGKPDHKTRAKHNRNTRIIDGGIRDLDESVNIEDDKTARSFTNPSYATISGNSADHDLDTSNTVPKGIWKEAPWLKMDLRRTCQPAYPHAQADERECLSHALRAHSVALVDNVVFKESELPDELIRDSCITDDECDVVRQLKSRRDQVRVLLTFIRSRDLEVLQKFLDRLKQTNPDIEANVKQTYEENKLSKLRPMTCAMCTLIERVNVKYVSDRLIEIHAIAEGLYNEIIFNEKPAGAQRELWIRVLDALNSLPPKNMAASYAVLCDTLSRKFYKYVQADIKRSVNNGHKLSCKCNLPPAGPRVSDPASCASPRSSTDDWSRGSRDSRELLALNPQVCAPASFASPRSSTESESRGSRDSKELLADPEQKDVSVSDNAVPIPAERRDKAGRKKSVGSFSSDEILETIMENTESRDVQPADNDEEQEEEDLSDDETEDEDEWSGLEYTRI